MSVIGKGDALVLAKFDRLGRNMLDMLMISEELKAKGANLVSLAEQIDTSTTMGNAFFQINGIFAEMERGRIRERQREGIERAKAAGVYKGRPPVNRLSRDQAPCCQWRDANSDCEGHGLRTPDSLPGAVSRR
jgi:DNA invertase Pin-like site-specific DNA recombinase